MSRLGSDDDAHQREQRREIEHHAEREQEQQDVAAHDREEAQQPLDQRRVGVRPRDQLPGRHPVEVVEVQRLQVVVHVVAQVVLHLRAPPARLDSGGCTRSRSSPPRVRRAGGATATAPTLRVRMTPSTIWRATSGTAVWQTLPEHRGTARQHDVAPVPQHVAPQSPDPPGRDGSFAQPRSLVVRWILSQTN